MLLRRLNTPIKPPIIFSFTSYPVKLLETNHLLTSELIVQHHEETCKLDTSAAFPSGSTCIGAICINSVRQYIRHLVLMEDTNDKVGYAMLIALVIFTLLLTLGYELIKGSFQFPFFFEYSIPYYIYSLFHEYIYWKY